MCSSPARSPTKKAEACNEACFWTAGRSICFPVVRISCRRCGYYLDHDALLYRCALAYSLNAPLALHGHTGVGKTELVRYFAAISEPLSTA